MGKNKDNRTDLDERIKKAHNETVKEILDNIKKDNHRIGETLHDKQRRKIREQDAKVFEQGMTVDNLISWGKKHDFEIDDRACFGFTMTRKDIKVRVWVKKI